MSVFLLIVSLLHHGVIFRLLQYYSVLLTSGVFVVTWPSRRYVIDTQYLFIYLFITFIKKIFLEILHCL